ncbi:MAG: DNA polymerase III subunit gamma/tau [Prevotella sp.]|nr:DNA polymerase III subunit gamma/tau [Prevotella sp.]
MEYIVSARKYRPMTFGSVVGQTALTTTLKNAVKSGKLAHAFLFCGPRGVGKTTCARIFAKTINCEHISADGEACNECESCRAFNEQRSLNIFELDAASNNGVDSMRQLTEQTRIPPQMGRYKVFIIDEVHMLSAQAFNAFLKTLEEPPSYVIFILATTEKHKILPTIISRCQIYDFERMDVAHTVAHLKMVAEKEGVSYDEESLALIAEKADGGMRDALSIFDQCVSFCGGTLTYDKVVNNLNVLASDNYFQLVDLCLENKVADVMLLVNSIISNGFDGGQLVNGLASHLRNVLMAKDPSTLPLLEVSERQRARYGEQARKCPPRFIYQALRYCNECDQGYRQSSNKRLLVELTLIEVAQVLQEDEPGAGRPRKTLKSLFKNLVALGNQKAASQVAATEPHGTPRPQAAPAVAATPTPETRPAAASSSPAASPSPASPSPTPATVTRRPVPGVRPRGLGMFKQMEAKKEETNHEEEVEITNKEEQKPFSQEDLSREWLAMCNRMAKALPGLAPRLKNIIPLITDYPNIEIVVDNRQLLEQISQLKGRIRKTMAIYLHNGNIDFNIRLAKAEEVKPVLSKRELFEKITKENHAVEQLRQLLDLELA